MKLKLKLEKEEDGVDDYQTNTWETVQDYIGRFLRLLQYANGIVDTYSNQVYFFVEALLPDNEVQVSDHEPPTLQCAYERSLIKERYLHTHLEAVSTVSVGHACEQTKSQ